jgi:hypothetical protein
MGLSLYVTMGIFLLMAARDPSANRGVIAFAGWLNIAHAAVMAVMAVHLPNERGDLLIAAAVFSVIGTVLILLAPAKLRRSSDSAHSSQTESPPDTVSGTQRSERRRSR